jgi:hypothetical protein
MTAFANGKKKKESALSTDGTDVWSYGMVIAHRCEDSDGIHDGSYSIGYDVPFAVEKHLEEGGVIARKGRRWAITAKGRELLLPPIAKEWVMTAPDMNALLAEARAALPLAKWQDASSGLSLDSAGFIGSTADVRFVVCVWLDDDREVRASGTASWAKIGTILHLTPEIALEAYKTAAKAVPNSRRIGGKP